MVCVGCHTAKVRCINPVPCERCVRLGMKCVLHKSMQGKNRKHTGEEEEDRKVAKKAKLSATCSECFIAKVKCDHGAPCSRCARLKKICQSRMRKQRKSKTSKGNVNKEDNRCEDLFSKETSSITITGNHYGLALTVRIWTALAIRRRSLSLLQKSIQLALRCGFTMDSLMCNMPFVSSTICEPVLSQNPCGERLRWREIPKILLSACDVADISPSMCSDYDSSHLGHRWVYAKEVKNGVSRFFTSPAFEQEFCSWSIVQQTFIDNKAEVLTLFLPTTSKNKCFKAKIHQIMHLLTPETQPRASKFPVEMVKKDGGLIRAEVVTCICGVGLDSMVVYYEFRLPRSTVAQTGAILSSLAYAASNYTSGSRSSPASSSDYNSGSTCSSPVSTVSSVDEPAPAEEKSAAPGDDASNEKDLLGEMFNFNNSGFYESPWEEFDFEKFDAGNFLSAPFYDEWSE